MRFDSEHRCFDFYFLEKLKIEQTDVKKFCNHCYQQFLDMCMNEKNMYVMTPEKNAEWIKRTYLSTKMVMSATLLLNSAEYAMSKNLKVTVPYLLYYALFTAARAFIFSYPYRYVQSLYEITHTKLMNVTSDCIKNHLNKNLGEKLNDVMEYYLGQRELFSYKFPASGITSELNIKEVTNMCGLLVELAELSSYKVQVAFENKFLKDKQSWMDNTLNFDELFVYTLDRTKKRFFKDAEDWYRMDYIKRKVMYPQSIFFTMTEGMSEDYFGAWCDENCLDANFNPDLNRNIIFPIP